MLYLMRTLESAPHTHHTSRRRVALREQLIHAVIRHEYLRDIEYKAYHTTPVEGQADFVFAVEDEPHGPDDVFDKLRWGGQFVYITRVARKLDNLPAAFRQRGYEVMEEAGRARRPRFGLRVAPVGEKVHYFIARKIHLIRPREITERFTYHVELFPFAGEESGHIVMKEVPSFDRVVARLRARFTDLPLNIIHKRAAKFTEKIFPLFLTREAAMMKILERHLPEQFRCRVPHVIDLEKDSRGYVRRLYMNWLRNSRGGQGPLTQLEFARQSAELLQAFHDVAGVIHLDLRLDNFVITPDGVGFVDFGSSVRVGENIAGNPLLSTLFEELMRTSEIQRMLTKMKRSGHVTSHVIHEGHHKPDKAVDLFYLAVQINNPLANPDFRGLVVADSTSEEATAIKTFSDEILRPGDPAHPRFRSAGDIVKGLESVARQIGAACAMDNDSKNG